ncbi:MAG: serine/threonine-protein kinase [Minicystis sp.]
MSGDPKSGDTIDGRYLLGKELGRGGHGVVFRAVDTQTNEGVAVKVLRQNIAEDPQYAVRLWREAQSLRLLWGESVVRVHGFGNDVEGFVYMVMELLEGETLEDHLTDVEGFGDRMSSFEVLRTLDPVARALHTAHGKGIIHRDVKPANIFRVSPEAGGGVRLMDFGLVKIAGAEQLTQVGMIAGSPSYIAPEVWRAQELGSPARRVLAGGRDLPLPRGARALLGADPPRSLHEGAQGSAAAPLAPPAGAVARDRHVGGPGARGRS